LLVNHTTVQGTAADGLKRFLVRLFRELPSGVLIVGTAHDEVILEVDRASAPEIQAWAKGVIIEEMGKLLPGMPVAVESTICDNWSQKK
jgi:DNA polymerase I-like protein with 3'-5' exonuclease and polymerase domains